MKESTYNLIKAYADDILTSVSFNAQKIYTHHKRVSTYDHCLHVAQIATELTRKSRKDNISMKTVIRAALLHDYYLYDWHYGRKWHRLHVYKHPKIAAENAKRDFNIDEKTESAILTHMWPLTLKMPKTPEAWIVMKADRIATFRENFSKDPLK